MMLSTWLHSAPGLYTWGETYARLRAKLRPKPKYHDTVCQDLRSSGIVNIPYFLPPTTFNAMQAEFEAARQSHHPRIRQWIDKGCDNWAVVFTEDDPAFKATNAGIRDDDTINRAIRTVTGHRVDYWPPTMSYLEQKLAPGEIRCNDDSAQRHQDVQYPTVKVVLYMTHVSKWDGPFKFWVDDHDFPLMIMGPANTLIIADHSHFHARGQFGLHGRRVTLRISFRYLDSPRYRHRWLFDRIRPR